MISMQNQLYPVRYSSSSDEKIKYLSLLIGESLYVTLRYYRKSSKPRRKKEFCRSMCRKDKDMKKAVFFFSTIMITIFSFAAAHAAEGDIYSVDFTGQEAVQDWSNIENISFSTDDMIGNYMVVDGASVSNAPRSPSFVTGDYTCVEFDMMLPSYKADGKTENTIGGGNTGGIGFMQGETLAGVIGFRGSGQGDPSHILSMGETGSDYLNMQTGSTAGAYWDTWLHYKVIIDTKNKIGDIYVTDPETGIEYVHEGRFTPYISKITSLTDIGIVSNQGYAIALANLRVYETEPNKLTIGTPKERQIIQRNDENRAIIDVSGTYRSSDSPESVEICAELASDARRGESVDWKSVDSFADGEFSGTLELMAGGWYTVKVRVNSGGEYMEEEISKVGVGDIYLTAGQSNSASFGQDKTTPENDTVSTWNPETGAWVFSADPQVSWNGSYVGSGGSPWPTLGDYLTEKYGVPIGFISAGWGSSVVADFLPENDKHYKRIRIPLEEFGINGIKAVLWHQGESDAISGTSSEQYRNDLLTVIESSRSDARYDIPWVIARAAYHTQSSTEAEQRVVQGQISACNGINIFVGPTTDDLLDGYRSTTDHVHFRKAGLIEHGTRWGKALDAALYHGTEDIYIGNVYTDQLDCGYGISFKLNNTGADPAEYKAYMAVYKSGVLTDVSAMDSGVVEVNSFAEISGTLDLPQDTDGYEVKLFIWTGEDTPVTLPIKLV